MSPPRSANQPVSAEPPQLERLVDAFEEAWQSGTPPAIEPFLRLLTIDGRPVNDSPHRELLEELIKIDLEYRWRQAGGQGNCIADRLPKCPRLEDYVAHLPELGCLGQLPMSLIAEEYRVRRQWGDRPSHNEYIARFPDRDEKELRQTLTQVDIELGRDVVDSLATLRSPDANPACAPQEGAIATALPDVAGYEVLAVLGRGGMGVVYKARQRSLDRLVALKMILAADHAGSEELARFRSEAEAAARLQHPHIVQIHEVGEQAGTPYFSLEYVEGGTLAQQLAGTPQPARTAAQLMHTLARAMHYAHQQGIVHRDLKPANILLQRKSENRNPKAEKEGSAPASDLGFRISDFEPKITDFGLAKRLDKEMGQTQTGVIMGTPSYMAAEQAAGKARTIGPATDVYGLGAILYEMLTGRPPFKGQTSFDTLQQVLDTEPVPPMHLQPKVPRDLQTICLKCLRKAPCERYANALDLAEDLRRFLAGEPILARPISVWERCLKWARRRPAVAALVLVSSLAALGLVLGSVWYNARLRDALQLKDQERARATANFQKARQAVKEMLTEVGAKELAHVPQMEPVRRALLQKALRFYEEFLQENSTDPDVQQDAARAYELLGRTHEMLGQPGQAEEALRQALRLREQLAEQFPDQPTYRQDLAAVQILLGNVYGKTGAREKAEGSYRKALAVHEHLVRDYPGVATYEHALSVSHLNLGSIYGKARRFEQAQNHLQQALAALERLAREHPDVPDYADELATSQTNLGHLYRATNHFDAAEAAYRKSLEILEHLVQTHSGIPRYQSLLAGGHNHLGYLLSATQRPGEARVAYQKAMDIYERLTRDYPKVWDYALDHGVSSANMANLVRDMGEPGAALQWYARAIRMLEAQLQQQPRHPVAREGLRNAYWGQAETLSRSARHAEAIQSLDKALALDDGSGREGLRLSRAVSLAHLAEHAQATNEAQAIAKNPHASGETLYNLACVYALSAAAARQDAKLMPSDAQSLAERYATRAVELLAKAEAIGYFKNPALVEQLKKDTDLVCLFRRDDFKKWFSALEEKSKQGGK